MEPLPQPAVMVRPGLPAPDFNARTTQGPRKLADYRGRWLLFFSHPADFTPVCTTEFLALAKMAPRFEALGCDLLGLSVDSLFSHLAWVVSIRERFGTEIPFPIVEDPSMAIAQAYGMLDPMSGDSAAVRASFLIDPQGIVRALNWYPMTTGRSVAELLRMLMALQATDASGNSTPEGWMPGDAMLSPTPLTQDDAMKIAAHNAGETWYLRKVQKP